MKKFCILLILQFFSATVTFCQFSISGKVLDENNQPLVSATVLIENTFAGTYADRKGEFILKNLKKGDYTIKISFIGCETQSRQIKLEKNEIVEFKMSRALYLADEVIVQATRVNEKTPATYSTINKETLSENNMVQDMPYLLSYTPSMVVSSDAGTGVGYTNINIRGTDVKRINVTINGIPVNDAESHGVWWVDLPDLASSVDNTQIQRGVGTSTNGAGAFGATVNFQTTKINREPYAEINSSFGSFNTSKNTVNIGTGLINNNFAFDTRLSNIWSDGYIDRAFCNLKSFYVSGTIYGKSSILKLLIFSGEEHTYQAWNGVPKVKLENDTAGMRKYVNAMAGWGYIYGNQDDIDNIFNSNSRTYNLYNYKNQTDNYNQSNYQLHYSKEISKNLHADVALHYTKGKGYYESLKTNADFNEFNLPVAIFNADTATSSDFITQKWLDNDFYGVTYSFNYNKNKINAVIGGGWNQYSGHHFGDIIWAKIVTFDTEKYRWYKGTGNKKDFNTFLKINYLLTNNLNLYGDLQIRTINYSIGGFDDNLKNITQIHKYVFCNPKAGLMYDLSEKQKIYASFGISQREPDRGNFIDADQGKTPKPEELIDYEAGYEFRSTKLLFKGNFFFMNYIDQLILTGEINNVGDPVLTNVSKSYRQGIELESGLQILKYLSCYGNVTFSRNIIPEFIDLTDNYDTWPIQNKNTLMNKTISFSPSIVASGVIDFKPIKNIQLSFHSKYVGKQYIDNTQNFERMLNAYFIQNLSFSYTLKNKLFKEILLQFAVNNLFNEKYESNGWVYKYISYGSQNIIDGYFPQAGTSLMFKICVKI
jgi:iron complex outermembrane recepter protein